MKNKTKRNKKINLKDDYYNYYNLKWIKNYQIPLNENSVNLFSILQKKVNEQLLDIINKTIKHPKTNEDKNMSLLYESCCTYNKDLANKQFYYFMNTLDDLIQKNNLYDFIHWFYMSGFNFIFNINISNNIYNSKETILSITNGDFTFNNKNMYKIKNYKKSYIIFLHKIFEFIFGKEHKYNIEHIWKIESTISQYLYSMEENNIIENELHYYSIHSIKTLFHIDITKILDMLDIDYHKKIQVHNPNYLKKVGYLLSKHWNSPEWKEYWIYQIIQIYSMTNKKLNDIFFLFFNTILQGKHKDKPLKLKCLTVINNYMNIYFNKLYLKNFKNEKEIQFCNLLLNKIKCVFVKRLTNNSWLEKKTIDNALKKFNKINFVIGYNNNWYEENEYRDIIFSRDDKYGNYKKFVEIMLVRIKKRLKEKNNKTIWKNNGVNLYDVNAYYNGINNELIIPNAYLQPPFLDLSKSFEYNLSHIGTTLGHELIHAFDDEGCKLDEYGNYNNWWSKKDKEEYVKKQKTIISHYEKICKKDNVTINGQLVLGENIADIYGVSICEEVLENELLEKKITGNEQDKYFKDFYENYCYSWKSKVNKTHSSNLLMNDVHSLSKYRVNCVLQNSKRFQHIYSIEKTDDMYNDIFIDIW